MDTILVPASFTNRRKPFCNKVEADAVRMYNHARYAIVIDGTGKVKEVQRNLRTDGTVLDCLVVLAPFEYEGVCFDKVLVLEIGFRRFVPYAQTEFRKGMSTKRGPVVRKRKGEPAIDQIQVKTKKVKPVAFKPRIPVASLSKDAMFDLMPAITEGMQVCTDDIVKMWTGKPNVRWAVGGTSARKVWMKHEIEPTITVRIPKEAEVLCATASFAEFAWRMRPEGHIDACARGIKTRLKSYLVSGRRSGKDARGNYSDDYVKEGQAFYWVAELLKNKVERGYSTVMVEALLDFIGLPKSPARKLVEQIWRVYKLPRPKKDKLLEGYYFKYGEMKDLLLERWHIRNYRSLRLETVKRNTAQKRAEENKTYRPHAQNSYIFSIFASKKAQEEMVQAYSSRFTSEVDNTQPISGISQISYTPKVDDDWDPFETADSSNITASRRSVTRADNDDDIPF